MPSNTDQPPSALPIQTAARPSDATLPECVTATIPEASRRTGLSRSEIYRLLAARKLAAVKSGARTLIVWASVTAYLADLPVATFRKPS